MIKITKEENVIYNDEYIEKEIIGICLYIKNKF